MKSIFFFLLLLTFKTGSAQSLIALINTPKLICSLDTYSENNFSSYNSEIKSKHQNRIFFVELNSNCKSQKKNFNPFQFQQMSFTWATMKFNFQFDVCTTFWGVLEKTKSNQFQNKI